MRGDFAQTRRKHQYCKLKMVIKTEKSAAHSHLRFTSAPVQLVNLTNRYRKWWIISCLMCLSWVKMLRSVTLKIIFRVLLSRKTLSILSSSWISILTEIITISLFTTKFRPMTVDGHHSLQIPFSSSNFRCPLIGWGQAREWSTKCHKTKERPSVLKKGESFLEPTSLLQRSEEFSLDLPSLIVTLLLMLEESCLF